MKRWLVGGLLALSFATPALALEGATCATKPILGPGKAILDAKSIFFCEGEEGGKTVKDLYKAGWKVAHIIPAPFVENNQSYMMWTLIIEKE